MSFFWAVSNATRLSDQVMALYNFLEELGVAKQLRGLAVWSDGKWYEVNEPEQGVTYQNHNPELITLDARGVAVPTGKTGMARVTLRCGSKEFDVTVIIKE